MKTYMPLSLFVLVEVIVVAFILTTVGVLPEYIASHFNGVGIPNGFMSHKGYTVFMLAFTVGIPSLILSSISFVLNFSS